MENSRRAFVFNGGAAALSAPAISTVMAVPAQAGINTRTLRVVEEGSKSASLAIEAETGRVLRSRNMSASRIPASLVKPFGDMVYYDAIRDPKVEISLDDEIELTDDITHAVAREEGSSHRFLRHHGFSKLTVDEAINLKVLQSMNEAALMLAAHFEERTGKNFVEAVQNKAEQIGCTDTTMRNATGYYHAEQRSTPRDLCLMAQHLIQHYPNEYGRYSQKSGRIQGRVMNSFNRFLGMPEADGVKTGRLSSSGAHNLGSAVSRDGRRVITLVMGASKSSMAGNANMQLAKLALDRHSRDVPGLATSYIGQAANDNDYEPSQQEKPQPQILDAQAAPALSSDGLY